MSYLTAAEMNTHIYGEAIASISRDDASLMDTAIVSAIEEARGFLVQRYDADAIFNATGSNRNPILLVYVKDLAAWHFCAPGNTNVDLELRKERYDSAVRRLKDIQAGINNPSLPAPPPDAKGNDPETGIQWSSNQRRNNQCNF